MPVPVQPVGNKPCSQSGLPVRGFVVLPFGTTLGEELSNAFP